MLLRNGEFAAAAGILGGALYMNTAGLGWTFDDFAAVSNNRDVDPATPLHSALAHDFWGLNVTSPFSHKSYRPITVQSFRASAILAGSVTPTAMHAGNVLLYACVCLLVTRILLAPGDPAATPSVGAICSTVWWVTHPIHTEAVASVVGRAELLCAASVLLGEALWRAGVARSDRNVGSSILWYVGAIALVLIGTLSKETGITATVLLAAPDVGQVLRALWLQWRGYYNDQSQLIKRRVWVAVTRVAILAAVAIAYLIGRRVIIGRDTPTGRFEDNPLRFIKPTQRVLTALYLQTENFRLLVWPWRLSCDYSFNAIPYVKNIADPRLLFPTAPLYAGTALVCGRALRNACIDADYRLLVSLSWIIVPLLPTSHIVEVGLVLAERTLFLPSLGVAMLIKLTIEMANSNVVTNSLTRHTQRTFVPSLLLFATVGTVCTAFTYRTVTRNRDWSDNGSLFQSALAVYPNSVKVLYGAGNSVKNGTRAQELYSKAIEIYPYAYMQHAYYRDLDKAVAYALHAGRPAACYFRRGRQYFGKTMVELIGLLETELQNAVGAYRCRMIDYLMRLNKLPNWDDRSPAKVAEYSRQFDKSCVKTPSQ